MFLLSFMDTLLANLVQFGFIFIFLIICLTKIPDKKKLLWGLLLLSIFTFIVINLSFKDVAFAKGGYSGDMGFLTAYVTKFANFNGFIDFGYKGLTSFYPPLYYYILGKISAIFSIPPYKMLKYGMLTACFMCPFISFWIWRKITDFKIAILLGFSILLFHDWYKINAWIALILFVPWWLYYVENIYGKFFTRKNYIIGGLIGGIIVMLQYYWILIGLLFTLIKYVINFIENRYTLKPAIIKADIQNKLKIGFIALLVAGFYLIPYAYTLIFHETESLQNNYFVESMIFLPFDSFKSIFPGLLYITSLIYLIFIANRDAIAKNLSILILTIYIFCFTGNLMVWTETPVLHFKSHYFLKYLLAVIFFYAIGHALFINKTINQKINTSKTPIFISLILLLIFLSQYYYRYEINFYAKKDGEKYQYPAETIQDVKTHTNGNYKGNVYLFDQKEPVIFLPLFAFLMWNPHFSHPAALHSNRVNFIKKVSIIKDPDFFTYALKNNDYNKIDGIFFKKEQPNILRFTKDNFPNGVKNTKIHFDSSLVHSRIIEKKEGKKYIYWKLKDSNLNFKNYINFDIKRLTNLYLLSDLLKNECRLPETIDKNKLRETLKNKFATQKTLDNKYKSASLILLKGETITSYLSTRMTDAILNKPIKFEVSDFKIPKAKRSPQKIEIDSTSQEGIFFYGNYMDLPKGKYKASINYQTNAENCSWDIVSQYGQKKLFQGNLNPQKTSTSTTINIDEKKEGENLEIRGYFSGKRKLTITNISITPIELY